MEGSGKSTTIELGGVESRVPWPGIELQLGSGVLGIA